MNPFRQKNQSEPAQATQVQPVTSYSPDPTSLDSSLESTNIEAKNLALEERNQAVARASERHQQIEQRAMRQSMVRYGVLGLIFLVAIGLVFFRLHAKPSKSNLSSVDQKYSTQKLQLGDISDKTGASPSKDNSVDVNGQLYVNSSLVLSPVSEPSNAVAGQLYYDADSGQLRFYDGASFNTLATSNNVITSLGGTTGSIDLGSGLALDGNQLVNTGVQSITAGNNISISDDGAGNLTIDSLASGSGNVSTDSNGTPGRLAKFTGAQTIADSLIGESGSTVTVNGSLQVTGALSLGTALSVGQGGTGLTSLTANQLVFASSASTIGQLSNGANGQCLVSNGAGSAPSFQACPGGGSSVASLNGQTGVITLANATGASGTITINDAKADGVTKGIAAFNSTNFSAASGVINTIQDINSTATPTFNSLNLTTALSTTNGGTGATSFTTNGSLYYNGTKLASTAAGITGQCLLATTGGAPSFGTCPGSGGVSSINSLTGGVTLANATTAGSTITINSGKADGVTKGIVTFSSSNFSDNGSGLISIKSGGVTTAEILDGTITNSDLASNLNASNIVGVGTITSGTWQGSAIQDAYVADNLTVSSAGTVDWQALNNYPAACAAGQAITQLGDTITCATFAAGSGSGNYIQNQSASDQTADFRISGTGRANTALQTPLLDTATAVSLNIGTTNAVQINLNKNVVIAAGQSITVTGGTSASRPASPTEGMLYYDTSTHQLLQYNGTKWVSDRSSNTKIVAPSTASQAIKDSADYVASGTNDESVINAALTAATGGTVLLLPGTYTTTGTILIPDNTTLAGSGRYNTLIKFNVGSATDNLIENSNTSSGTAINIHDLRLDDSLGTGGTQNAISLSGVDSGSNGVRNNITNIYIGIGSWPHGNAIVLTNSSVNRISDVYIGQTGANIVMDANSAVESFINNLLLSNLAASNVANLSDNTLADVSVIGGEVNNFSNNALGNVTVSGNATNSALILTFNDNFVTSLTVDGTLNPTALVQVSGNTFAPQTGSQDGIKLIASDIGALIPSTKTNIVDNTFVNEGTTGYAININNTSQSVYLSNNTLGGMAINNAASDTVYAGQVNSAGNYLIQPAGTVELLKNTNVTGNLAVSGTTTSTGLITASNGLTVSAGTITFNNLTGGSSKCLTLDASNHVGVATCAVGSGSTPTLQNVYDNSGATPNITLSNANGGITIQDASTAVSGNLFAVKNNAGTITYLGVTSSGVNVTGTVTGTNFSGNGSGLTNVDAATLNGQAGSYYTNASNISSGTLNDSRLSTNVALYNRATSNFTGNLQHNGNAVCDTSGNCSGVGGGVTTAGGTANTIAMFSGAQTLANSLLSQNAGATAVTVSGDLSVTGNVTANAFSGDGTNVTNVNAAKLNGNDSTFYTNASNLSTGTLPTGRLSGSYTGVTGTGALAAGSIASGFGTIVTTNTITGSTLNGTIGLNTGAGAGTQRIDASGNLVNIGTISTSGLITGGNGLTISAGTVTLSSLTGGASTCLTLDASSHVGTATCAVGSGSTPTLQNVYDNSGATPNILLASLGKGITIQDAAVSVGGNLLAVKNNAGNVTYLGVTTTGTSINGNLTATGTITFSGKTAGLGIFDNSGVLTSGSIDLGLLPSYVSGTLPIGNGGTGGTSFGPTNSVIYYDGSKLASTNAGTTGQCLLATTGGAPSFGTCTGAGGVSSITATTTQSGALTFASNASQVSVSNSGGTFSFTLPQSIATTSDVQFHSLDATNLLKTGGTTRIDASGNLSNIGTISTSGLITAGNGLTVGAGTITLNNLTGGSSTCLTLNGSNQVSTATCATGSGSTPTLQNVYDNSGATPNILLSNTGKGLTIQDASSSVGGNLLAIKNNAGTTTYFDVTTSGADITGSLSVTNNVTLSNASLTGGAAAGKCLTTDNSGVLQLTSCLSGSGGGSGGVSSLNGLSGSISLANATAAGSTVTINKAKADGSTLGLAAFGSANFADNGSGIITIKTGGVGSTEIADGSIADADLSTGTFTHVTGTGALSAGSIASGFGSIVTTNTITGNIVNGTNGVYSGGTAAGNLRIDASGNLSNIGTITTSGLVTAGNGLTVSAGTITLNNLTGGTGQCLTLDASSHVGVNTCATGSGSSPTLQNVYDNSTTSPDIILSATGGGIVIQDAGTTVGNLLTVSNSGNTTKYLNVTATGTTATGTITFSGLASATGGVVFASAGGALSVTSNAGTTGQCLLSNGSGNAPSFNTCPGNGALPTNGSATDNTISKFSNSATKLTDSQIRDDGTHVTIGNSGASTGGLFNVGNSDQFQVSSAGAITAVGVNAGAGLIQGSAGLTISGGNITLSSLSSGTAAGCLALDASNHVVTTSCAPGTGGTSTNNYILNQATLQTSANFFIQGAASSVTAVVQGASGGGDIADFNTSGGSTVTSIDASGHIKYVASGTSGATLVCQNASGQLAGCSSSYQTALTFNNGLTNTAGTVGLGGTLNSATTIAAGNANNITITSDLSGGARSTYPLVISQANNATNDNSVGLINLSNSDTGSTAALLNISQVSSGIGISINGNPTGSGISFGAVTTGSSASLSLGALTSGYGIALNTGAAGQNTAFTGYAIGEYNTRTYTATGLNQTGNELNLNRSVAINSAGGTLSVTGAVANLQSTCTQTAGTCNDSSNILNLGQNYANATGAVLNASNAGSGSIISLTQSKALGSNAAISLNYTGGNNADTLISLQNGGTPKFTVDASGNVVALGTYNTDTINGTNFTFGGASTATISTTGANALGIDAGGAASVSIGTTNANAVNISKSGVTTTINGSATISQLLTANAGLNVSAGNTFTNSSSTLNTALALGNLASGPIGANSATVDVSTAFTINPSAAGRSYTIPSPTNTAAGRVIFVSNISGSFSFDIGGVTVPAGANAGFLWNGSAWAASNVSTGASVVGSLNGGTANANGASISGNTLYLQSASASFAGLVDTNNGQVFHGTKSFDSLLTAGAGFTANNGAITLTGNAASSFTTTSGALTLTSAAAATWGTSAGDLTIQANGTSNLNLGTSGAGTVNIGTVGSINTNSTVHIADSTQAIQTVTIGSAANNASTTLIQGGNGTTAGSEAIRIVPNSAGAVTIGGTSQTGAVNVGVSTVTNTVNIGNNTISAGNTQTINIGTSSTSTGKDVVTIGSLNDGSSTTLQAGTGGIINTLASNTSNAFVLQNNTQSLSSTGQLMTFSAATSASNLLTNPSFEDSPITSWAADNGASAPTRDTTQAYNGVASGKIVTAATANQGIKQNLSALSGTYTVSFYAKLDASSSAFATMVFGLYNGTNETTYVSGAQTVVTGGWTRYSATFSGVSTTGTPYFFAKQTDATAHTFYIDQVQVESGSNASGQGIGTLQVNSIVSAPLTLQNSVNSTNAFSVYDASGNIVFGIDTLNRKLVFGAGVTAAHSKYITLTPEYVGAVLDVSGDSTACGSANSGTMTSGFDSGGTKQNYYQWVSGTAGTNCYDVVVSVPIPADFASWSAGPTIYAANSSSLASSICLQILNSSGSTDTAYSSYSCATPGTSIAALSTFATPTSAYSIGSNNTITLKIRMTSNSTSNLTKLGNISIPYQSLF